jgi:hypothetical protein
MDVGSHRKEQLKNYEEKNSLAITINSLRDAPMLPLTTSGCAILPFNNLPFNKSDFFYRLTSHIFGSY